MGIYLNSCSETSADPHFLVPMTATLVEIRVELAGRVAAVVVLVDSESHGTNIYIPIAHWRLLAFLYSSLSARRIGTRTLTRKNPPLQPLAITESRSGFNPASARPSPSWTTRMYLSPSHSGDPSRST
jgi:hypothetical protein